MGALFFFFSSSFMLQQNVFYIPAPLRSCTYAIAAEMFEDEGEKKIIINYGVLNYNNISFHTFSATL